MLILIKYPEEGKKIVIKLVELGSLLLDLTIEIVKWLAGIIRNLVG